MSRDTLRLVFLGTGSADVQAARQNTTLAIQDDQWTCLVDCSGSPANALLRAGVDLRTLGDVVLTHSHPDHIYALPSLMHGLWLEPQPYALRVHGPSETLEICKGVVSAMGLPLTSESLMVEWLPIAEASSGSLGLGCSAWSAHYFDVTHGKGRAIGLGLDSGAGGRLVYSGDALADHAVRTQLQRAASLLVQDCGGKLAGNAGHAGADQIAVMLKDASVTDVILVHLPPLTAEEDAEIRRTIATTFEGRCELGRDGLRALLGAAGEVTLQDPPNNPSQP